MIRIFTVAGFVTLAAAFPAAIAVLALGCTLYRPAPQTSASPALAASCVEGLASTPPDANVVDDQPAVIRVAGDVHATVTFEQGEFRYQTCRIPTPLPTGYPAPTPPGAIDLKRYPSVRRAQIGGTMSPDWGMNLAFFPLFSHIKRRDIAMTSPVEVNYSGLDSAAARKPESWTMSFLYRSADQGPSGIDPEDERILIEDIPSMSVVSIGMRGPYKLPLVNAGLEELRNWLEDQSEWEEAGDPRALFYNGPEASKRDLWSELQIPVRRR